MGDRPIERPLPTDKRNAPNRIKVPTVIILWSALYFCVISNRKTPLKKYIAETMAASCNADCPSLLR